MKHQKYLTDLIEQYKQKNLAYDNSAHKTFCKYGKVAYSLRLSDKFQRLENLLSNPEIDHADESISDTLGDAITYTAMYAADIYYDLLHRTDPDDTCNIEKTIEILKLLSCCSEEEIDGMADVFSARYCPEDVSLTEIIYKMYAEEATPVVYALLASYLIQMHNKGVIRS